MAPPKSEYFFSNIGNQIIFFYEKKHNPPFKINGRSLSTIDQTKPSIDTGIHKDQQIHDDSHFILEERLQKFLPNCQICSSFVCVCVCVIELMLEKTEEEIKNRISRDTGNIEYKTQKTEK